MMLVEWEETITESSHIIYLYICIASNVFLKPRLIARLFVLSSEEKRGSEFSAKLNLTIKEKQEKQKLCSPTKRSLKGSFPSWELTHKILPHPPDINGSIFQLVLLRLTRMHCAKILHKRWKLWKELAFSLLYKYISFRLRNIEWY